MRLRRYAARRRGASSTFHRRCRRHRRRAEHRVTARSRKRRLHTRWIGGALGAHGVGRDAALRASGGWLLGSGRVRHRAERHGLLARRDESRRGVDRRHGQFPRSRSLRRRRNHAGWRPDRFAPLRRPRRRPGRQPPGRRHHQRRRRGPVAGLTRGGTTARRHRPRRRSSSRSLGLGRSTGDRSASSPTSTTAGHEDRAVRTGRTQRDVDHRRPHHHGLLARAEARDRRCGAVADGARGGSRTARMATADDQRCRHRHRRDRRARASGQAGGDQPRRRVRRPALAAALSSDVGYIGALGSRRTQQARADWLAYRGITDLEPHPRPGRAGHRRDTPAEIAVSILAEAIAAEAAEDVAATLAGRR